MQSIPACAPFRHRRSEAADQAVLLDHRHGAEPAEGVGEEGLVEWFDGVHADDAGREPLGLEFLCGREGDRDKRAHAEQADVAPFAHHDPLADLERRRRVVHRRLTLLAESDVGRPGEPERRLDRRPHLGRVGRAENGEVGKTAEDADILAGMVRGPQRSVGEAAAGTDDHHRHVVVADVDTDLLDHARRGEGGDGVGEGAEPTQRQSRCHAGHVRLGHPTVVEPVGEPLTVAVEEPIADVAREQDDPLVGRGQVGDRGGEGVSHAGISG